MSEWLMETFGMDPGWARGIQVLIAFIVVFVLLAAFLWVMRRLTRAQFGGHGRTRQPRLAIMDQTHIDNRRRLILVRRDNIEHLVLVGGPTDLVVEQGIVRGQAMAPRQPYPQVVHQAPPGQQPAAVAAAAVAGDDDAPTVEDRAPVEAAEVAARPARPMRPAHKAPPRDRPREANEAAPARHPAKPDAAEARPLRPAAKRPAMPVAPTAPSAPSAPSAPAAAATPAAPVAAEAATAKVEAPAQPATPALLRPVTAAMPANRPTRGPASRLSESLFTRNKDGKPSKVGALSASIAAAAGLGAKSDKATPGDTPVVTPTASAPEAQPAPSIDTVAGTDDTPATTPTTVEASTGELPADLMADFEANLTAPVEDTAAKAPLSAPEPVAIDAAPTVAQTATQTIEPAKDDVSLTPEAPEPSVDVPTVEIADVDADTGSTMPTIEIDTEPRIGVSDAPPVNLAADAKKPVDEPPMDGLEEEMAKLLSELSGSSDK